MPKNKIKLIDTNVIVRFLTRDDPKLTKKAEKILKNAESGQLEIPDFILTEIVWLLLSYYKIEKEEVIEKLEGMLAFDKFKLNRKVLREAVDIYRDNNISFVDAYLLAKGEQNNQKVISFDKKVLTTARKYSK